MSFDNKHWKTEEIVALLKPISGKIVIKEVGGDQDTANLLVCIGDTVNSYKLFVAGFTMQDYPDYDKDINDMDIDFVEVTDGYDSRGGFNGDTAKQGEFYGKILGALVHAGYQTAPTYKDYF